MELNRYIDHTNLSPDATAADIELLCREAVEYGFYAVCVNPCRVAQARSLLQGTGIRVACVVGFPLGANTTYIKKLEAERAVAEGVDEVDMVVNIGAVKEGDCEYVYHDIKAVVDACKVPVKVILETSKLTKEEIASATETAVRAGAAFVKTSTGFLGRGAEEDDVRLMAKTAGGRARVKASGGIRTREDAEKMIAAGASRLGTSAGIAIVGGRVDK